MTGAAPPDNPGVWAVAGSSDRAGRPPRAHLRAQPPRCAPRVEAGAGPSGGGGAWRGAGAGGRGGPRCSLIGPGATKRRGLGEGLQAGIGRRGSRAWPYEVSSGLCKTPGAAADGLQMLLGRGVRGAGSQRVSVRPSARATRRGMAGTGNAAAAATGRLLVLLLLGLTAPAAALAGYIEVGSGRAPERSLFHPPWSAACGRAGGLGASARGEAVVGAAAGPAPPPPPCLAQCLALEVGQPRPPQRPNERHRGCGGRRTASAAPARIPPAAPPLLWGTLRGPDARRALPRDGASLGPQLRTSGTVVGFPSGKRLCILCWRGAGSVAGCSRPARPVEVPRVRASALLPPLRAVAAPAPGPRGAVRRGCRPASAREESPSLGAASLPFKSGSPRVGKVENSLLSSPLLWGRDAGRSALTPASVSCCAAARPGLGATGCGGARGRGPAARWTRLRGNPRGAGTRLCSHPPPETRSAVGPDARFWWGRLYASSPLTIL